MVNSIPTLLTVEDCDRQIELAKTGLIAIQFEQNQLDKKNGIAIKDGPAYERELQSTEEQISFYEENLPAMPAGPGKDVAKSVLDKLYVKRTSLLNKKDNYGTDSLFEQQGEYIGLGGKVIAFQGFIAALEARREELV